MILGPTAEPSTARKLGEGTCCVCGLTNVLTSLAKASKKNYCRGVRMCKDGAGINVKGSGVRKQTGAVRGEKREREAQEEAGGAEERVIHFYFILK